MLAGVSWFGCLSLEISKSKVTIKTRVGLCCKTLISILLATLLWKELVLSASNNWKSKLWSQSDGYSIPICTWKSPPIRIPLTSDFEDSGSLWLPIFPRKVYMILSSKIAPPTVTDCLLATHKTRCFVPTTYLFGIRTTPQILICCLPYCTEGKGTLKSERKKSYLVTTRTFFFNLFNFQWNASQGTGQHWHQAFEKVTNDLFFHQAHIPTWDKTHGWGGLGVGVRGRDWM